MKEITKLNDNLYHVVSEPGDATRYDYKVYVDYDDFYFMPKKNTFRYPQRLNYFGVKDFNDEQIMSISDKENCNPHTLIECIRTLKELRKF